ncbi:MAG: endonuclease NucS, partial [Candidatus Pacearchaeota archaeon]
MTNEDAQLTEQRSQLTGMLKNLIRKKLEDMVLDTMDHPEHVPDDFIECYEIARQEGFTDILEGFNEIFREVGQVQTERVLKRRKNLKINQEEKALQSYFIANNGEQLNSIEQGLKYVAHEKPTRAGRLDILASDKEGKEVKIELKARDYDSRKVFFQIMKYFNDDKTGNARLIFVAPKVKADLLFALAEYERSGRMRFFEVEKQNGGYVMRRKTSEDVPEPTLIKWTKRPRRTLSKGLVKVVSGMPRQDKMCIKESGKGFEGGEEIPQGTFGKEQELYYQALMILNPELADKERYLQPMLVDERQMNSLQSLVETPELKTVLENYANTMRLLRKGKIQTDKGMTVAFLLGKQSEHLDKVIAYFSKLSKTYKEDFEKITYEDLERDFLNFRKDLSREYISANKIVNLFRKMVIKAKKKVRLPVRAGIDSNRLNIDATHILLCKMIKAYFDSKLDRTLELMKFDKNLALSYFICGDAYSVKTREEGYEYPNSYAGQLFFIFDAIYSDNEVYKSILSNIKVRQGNLKQEGIERKVLADIEMPKMNG